MARIFTISLLCNCDKPRYEENKAVAKIGGETARYCHSSNICCVSAAVTAITVSLDSPTNSKL